MGIFTRFGDLIIRALSFVGMLILSIPKIPEKIRNMDTGRVKDKFDTGKMKKNMSRIKDEVSGVKDEFSGGKTGQTSESESVQSSGEHVDVQSPIESVDVQSSRVSGNQMQDSSVILVSGVYTSEEKERTILTLQIASAAFIVFAILYVFNFLSLIIFLILTVLCVGFVIYMLVNRVKKMYPKDFNAYRDFFLMYVAVGFIIVIVSSIPSLLLAFSFQSLPSLSVLIYAIIAVVAVFLIFRMKYYRKYTYGTVLEAGENTAHVKVEYDIRSNVKPKIYLVENRKGAMIGDTVKLKIEEKIISTGGNKPLEIMEVYKKI